MRILLVSTPGQPGEKIARSIGRMGHAVDWEKGYASARDAIAVQDYALGIVELRDDLSHALGLVSALCARTPVLALANGARTRGRLEAFRAGADDCVSIPFHQDELDARVRALIRRRHGNAVSRLSLGDLILDQVGRRVYVKGRAIALTRREVALLEILLGEPDKVFPKSELLDQLYGFDSEAAPNTIELYVARLRRKLFRATAGIRTVRGIGYQIVGEIDDWTAGSRSGVKTAP